MNKSKTYFEINELVSRLLDIKEKGCFNFGNVVATILNTPTIKLVRCKDCKHFMEWDNYNPPQYTCKMWTDQWDMATEPNGYCHYGELRD